MTVSPHAPSVDAETVDYFRSVFEQHIRADNLMGPHHLVDVVRAQAALLDQILPDAKNEVRDSLLVLACRYNEFAGWLYQDAGDPPSAMHFSDRAMDYALTIGDLTEVAYLLMRKSNIASDLGGFDRAIGLSTAALRDAQRVSPRVRALGCHSAQLACRLSLGRSSMPVKTPGQRQMVTFGQSLVAIRPPPFGRECRLSADLWSPRRACPRRDGVRPRDRR